MIISAFFGLNKLPKYNIKNIYLIIRILQNLDCPLSSIFNPHSTYKLDLDMAFEVICKVLINANSEIKKRIRIGLLNGSNFCNNSFPIDNLSFELKNKLCVFYLIRKQFLKNNSEKGTEINKILLFDDNRISLNEVFLHLFPFSIYNKEDKEDCTLVQSLIFKKDSDIEETVTIREIRQLSVQKISISITIDAFLEVCHNFIDIYINESKQVIAKYFSHIIDKKITQNEFCERINVDVNQKWKLIALYDLIENEPKSNIISNEKIHHESLTNPIFKFIFSN